MPRRSSDVKLRMDLVEMTEEIQFEDLKLAGEQIAPTVSVSRDHGAYPVLPREARMKVMDTRRKADGTFQRSDWQWDEDTYATYEYGFEEPIDDVEALKDEEFINHEEVSAEFAKEGLFLGRESRLADALLNETKFAGKVTEISNPWDNSSAATPFEDIDAACKKLRSRLGFPKEMFSVALTDDLVEYAIKSDEVKGFFQYSGEYARVLRSSLDEKAAFLRSYFGVKEVIVTRALYDTSKLASSAKIGKFWSNEYILVFKKVPAPTLKAQGLVKQLRWSKYGPDYIMEDYYVPESRQTIIRAREYRGLKIDTQYGQLLSNAKTEVERGI